MISMINDIAAEKAEEADFIINYVLIFLFFMMMQYRNKLN